MDIKERNLEIFNLINKGLSVNTVAKRYNLSSSRINQIIKQQKDDQEIDKNSKELIKRIKQSENMDEKWPMLDLVYAINLSTKARIRMIKYFSGENKKEVSLQEIINSMALPELEYELSLKNIPILKQKQLGMILYREMVRSLSKVDFGEKFQKGWKERKKIIQRRFKFK